MTDINNTIVALSTPVGYGAIAVIRISGPAAIPTVRPFINRGFIFENRKVKLTKFTHNQIHIDDILISYFREPHSYTGEDIIEISCHGSPYIIETIIDCCIDNGAQLAEPGEFTKRAFLNEKMDLAQAEGVDSLIHSKTKHAHETAKDLLNGKVGQKIKTIKQEIIDTITLLELELDFSDQEIEFTSHQKIQKNIQHTKENINQLIDSYYYGKLLTEGIRTTIIGEPNSGKSSLMNAFLEEERVIVSEIPGTTRDFIEESFKRDGYQFRLFDTAGLRETEDKIESIGIYKTKEKIKNSDLKLFIIDTTAENIDYIKSFNIDDQSIIVLNKIDIATPGQINTIKSNFDSKSIIEISAKEHINIHQLADLMVAKIKSIIPKESTIFITIKRHFTALKNTVKELETTLTGINNNNPSELIVTDLRFALNEIDQILGKTSDDDILNNIFSNFCIGK